MEAAWRRCLCWATVMAAAAAVCGGGVEGGEVTYDRRSLIIEGKRQILFSGSIHYPRSTPEMWPDLIAKAKQGGIDVIQTYVFWNLHEPQPGQYDFSGRSDLVKFIKEVKKQGLYVTLRIGPFIEAEWNYGGLPVWLRFVPNIVYRSDNEPFKFYMRRFTTKIVNMMQSEGLYASQGGPIILSQIENEYQNIEAAFGAKGPRYVSWAANMAVGLNTGVPWVMCKQSDAPDPVINACNGMRCGETFAGPNSRKKPAIWTENWTSFFQTYGAEAYIRSAEDIAFHVTLFIAKLGGSYINYYMYHGGTNLGRTGSEFVITSYYDEAPLDEYGLIREPKWSHLKELHAAIKACSRPLLEGVHSNYSIGKLQQAYVFQEEKGGCVAFLVNNDGRHNVKVQFKKASFDLLPKSVTLLKDCATVIFSTAKVSTGFNKRTTVPSQILNSADKWKKFRDVIPNFKDTSIHSKALQEQLSMTRDTTDYLWYTFSLQPESRCLNPVLFIESLGHVAHVFVNKAYAGYAHGSPKSNGFTFEPQIKLHNGINSISILSVMVGLRDSGAFLEKKHSGLNKVHIQCSQQKSTITNFTWGYQVGLRGEKSRIYGEENSGAVEWSSGGISTPESLTWYKAEFKTPPGHNPVVLNLSTMRKGEAWVNGQSIGRYWVSYHTPKGQPSQSLYHVPRSFLETTKSNVLVLFEEVGGNPLLVSVNTVSAHQPPLAAHLSSP